MDRDLIRMFILAIWLTLCIWAYVEYKYREKYTVVAPTVTVVAHPEQTGE